MVLGVCHRLLGNPHDAEDAFQATFLVLVRKARSLVRRETVGNWLYGVACKTALKARAAAARRRFKEAQVIAMPRTQASAADHAHDWQPLLDDALSRLSDKFREPVVLCDLEGKTRREAARQLGVAEGTLSGRLTTARRLLAKRLARRGFTLSGGALAAVLGQHAATAAVPMPLVISTAKAATLLAAGQTAAAVASAKVAALTEGVMKAMLLSKLKVSALFLAVVGLLALGGVFGHQAWSGEPGDPANPRTAAPRATEQPAVPREAEAQRQRPEQPTNANVVSGTLEAVDVKNQNVMIGTFSRANMETTYKTYAITADTKIMKDGGAVKLEDLKQGGRATLVLTADQKSVVTLTVVGRTASGEFFDAGKKTITITRLDRNMQKVNSTLTLANDVKVTIDGKPGKLADLKEGTKVDLTFSADGEIVIHVQAGARKSSGNRN
jgi:RNA polymerase sigma factor (sigma-70 family)